MNYEAMSDFEINKAVAELIHSKARIETYWHKDTMRDQVRIEWSMGSFTSDFDPCNNPADAWPIIEANNISVQNWDDYSRAWVSDNCDIEFHDEESCRGLRAAMIVYLMMQESK